MGRCLIATDLPQRQQRRISNLFAAVISAPKAGSIGPAVLTSELPPQGHPLTPVAAPLVAALLPAGAPGGHVVERVGSDVTAIFLHLGRRPAKNADQHIAESFGSVAPSVFGFAHERNHEGSHDREVVNLCQGFGNVCRA